MHPAFQYQKQQSGPEMQKIQPPHPQSLATGSHTNYENVEYKSYSQHPSTLPSPSIGHLQPHIVNILSPPSLSSSSETVNKNESMCKPVLQKHDKIVDMSTTKDSGNESEIDHISENDEEDGSNNESEEIDLTSGGCIDYSNNNKI